MALLSASKRTAEFGLFVEQHDARAGSARRQGGREAGGTGADDGDVAMRVFEGVVVGIGFARRAPHARRATNDRLVDRFPRALRLHEGLVVEAGGHERGEQAVDGKGVPLERGPGVLAERAQALVELDLRRAQIGRDAALAGVERDERVGIVRAEGQDAARAVIFERSGDEMRAVGDERRGERVARAADVTLAVEGEAEGLGAIDAPALASAGTRRSSPLASRAC